MANLGVNVLSIYFYIEKDKSQLKNAWTNTNQVQNRKKHTQLSITVIRRNMCKENEITKTAYT